MAMLDQHVMQAIGSLTPDGQYIGYLTATKFVLTRNQSAETIIENSVSRKSPLMLITIKYKEIVQLAFIVSDDAYTAINNFFYGEEEESNA